MTVFFQGCALRVPGCLRRLTFAFGRLDKLTFSCKLYAGHHEPQSLEPLGSLEFSLEHSLVTLVCFLADKCSSILLLVSKSATGFQLDHLV